MWCIREFATAADIALRLHYSMWFLTMVHAQIVDRNLVFYRDEIRFHLNNRYVVVVVVVVVFQ